MNTTRRIPVKDDSYYTQFIRYIHFKQVKHGFTYRVGEWPYTSYQSSLSEKETSLKREEVLDWFGGKENFIKAHKYYKNPQSF